MIKKFLTPGLLVALLLPMLVFAAPTLKPRDSLTIDNVVNTIDNIANALFTIFVAVTVFFVLYAAYLYLKSGGEPEETGEARNYLIFAAVGVAVAIFARVLPGLVESLLR